MTDHFICMYASNLAAAVGLNPYKPPHEVLEDMWGRIDPVGFKEALHRNAKKSKEDALQAILDSDEQVATCVAEATAKDHETSSCTTETAQQATAAVSTRADLSKEEKKLVNDHLRSKVFTKYGTDKEDRVYKLLLEKHGLGIKKDPVFRKKKMGDIKGKGWFIGGKVDAVAWDRSQVVEIKNRVRRLFGRVVSYEHAQLQAYMQLLGIDRSTLVECYTGAGGGLDINLFPVDKDQAFWDIKVMPRLTAFLTLLIDLLDNTKVQNGYLNCYREGFVMKLLQKASAELGEH
jgi:hypothetical protein